MKLQVKTNPKILPEQYLKIIIITIIILLMIALLVFYDYQKTKNYIALEGKIEQVYIHESNESSGLSSKYIIISYEYKNKEYSYKQRIKFMSNPKKGEKATIKVNPDNPDEVKDMYNVKARFYLIIIGLFILAIEIVFYKERKNM